MTSSITKKVLSSLSVAALALTALTATSIPASAAAETKTITVAGFASNSTSLTQAMRTRINKFVNNNKDYGFITCVGFADRPGSKTNNNSLGQGRALAGCNQAVRANSDLSISGTRGKWDNTRAGSDVRRVKITLSKTAFANITTSFNYRGGEGAVTSLKSAIGDTITLPTATREGYSLVGWFTKRKGGALVGIAEGFHNPTKSRTLFARWVVGDAPVASSGVATLFRFNYTINLEEAEMLCDDGMSAIFLAVDDNDGLEVFGYEGDLLLTDQRVCTGTVEIDLQGAIDPLLAGYPFQFMFGLGDMCPDIVNISSPLGIWEQVPFYDGVGAFYSYSGVLQAGTNEISVVGSMPEYGTVCGGVIE